jgi:hypothetical protein
MVEHEWESLGEYEDQINLDDDGIGSRQTVMGRVTDHFNVQLERYCRFTAWIDSNPAIQGFHMDHIEPGMAGWYRMVL